MAIRAQLFDGTILEFPDDTDQTVIDRVAQEETLARKPAPQPVPPSTKRTAGEAAVDVGAGVLTGLGGLAQAPGQLLRLVPGLSGVGEALAKPGEWISEAGENLKSEGLKAREALRSQAISEAEKDGIISSFVTAITSTLKDPALITSFVAEQVPLLLGPAGAAKVTQLLGRGAVEAAGRGLTGAAAEEAAKVAAQQVGQRATRAAIGTGVGMQAADVSGDAYQDAYKRAIAQGMTEPEARDAALNAARIAGAGAGAASLATAGLMSKIGGSAIERKLAGVPGFTRPVSAFGEATSEGLEESAGQLFKNIGLRQVDPNQSLTEGVGAAAGLGALGGGFFGTILGGKPPEPLAAGQREGETLGQAATRLSRELAHLEQQINPPAPEKTVASVQDLVAMASQPQGWTRLLQYEDQLKQMPASPERDEAMRVAKELRGRLSAEEVSRKTPEGAEYPHGQELPVEPTPESPYPTFTQLVEMVNRSPNAEQALADLNEYADSIRNLPASAARAAHLKEVAELRNIIKTEAAARVPKGPEKFILKGADLANIGITRSDVLHHQLAGKNLTDPEQADYVVRQLENALTRANLTQAKFDAISGLLETVDQILKDVQGSGFYAQRTVTEPSGAGAGVVSGEVGPSAPKGSTEPKRTGVVPPTAYVGPPVSGEEGQPPSVVPEGEPAPYVEGPEPGLEEVGRPISDEIAQLEAEVRQTEKLGLKPNLFSMLIGKVDRNDVKDIGTSAGKIELQYRPLVKREGLGKSVSEFVNDGTLDDFLPYEMRHDAPNFNVQDSTEYIKDKLRQRIHISYETEEMLHKLNLAITDLMPLLEIEEIENERQRAIREINLKITQELDEQRERDQEAEIAAAEKPAGGVARTAGQKRQPKRARLTSEPFTIDVEARVISDVIERNLEALPDKQIAKLETAYKLVAKEDGKFTPEFIERVKQDIAQLEAEGTKAITESIRGVIGPLRAKVNAGVKQLGREPITIDVEARVVEETIAPQVAALPAPDVVTLENHYGVKSGSKEFLQKVKEDVVLFATKGANAVASAIRSIIKTIHAGVLSISLIFNPININPPEAYAVVPKATPQVVAPDETPTQQFVIDLAKVPSNVQGMSDAAQQAYQTLIPSLNGKIGDKLIVIADKPGGRVFVFTADGTLVAQNKALFGAAKGDLYKGNVDVPANRVTPAGLFGLKLVDAAKGGAAKKTAGEYEFGKVFALNDPEAVITIMHSVWLKEADAPQRKAALANQDAEDSRYSFGCINVDKDTFKFLLDNYQAQMDGAKLFVVPDNQAQVKEFLSGQIAQNVGGIKPGEGPDRLVREAVEKKSLREVAKNVSEGKFRELEKRAKTPSEPKPEVPQAESPTVTALKAQKKLKADQLQGILKKILAQYGLKGVELNLEEGMQDEGSYSGQLIKLALDNLDPVRVLRHESIHALKELGFFTPQQWKVLTDRANKEWIDTYLKNRNIDGKPLEPGQQSRYDAYMDLYKGDAEAVMEEAIADAFGSFRQTKPPAGMMKALMERLSNLFKAIKQAMNMGGYETAEDVFGAIEKGKLKGAAPVSNAEVKASLRNARVFYTDRYIKPVVVDNKTEGWDLINPVTLKNGTRLDGFSDVAQTTFKGYEQGRVRITQRVNTVDPEDIVFSKDSNRTAEALKKALLDLRQQKTDEAIPVKASLRNIQTDSANFKKWSSDAPIIVDTTDYKGGPAVFKAFHGTTHNDITVFDTGRGSKEGALGAGPYLSTSVDDVNANYAGVGPDLTVRIGREVDQISDAFYDDNFYAGEVLEDYFSDNDLDIEITDENFEELKNQYNDEAIQHAATKAVKGKSEGLVVPAYVRLLKPFDMRGNQGTYFTIESEYDAEGEPIGEPTGSGMDLIKAIGSVADSYNADASDLQNYIFENQEVTAQEVFDRASKSVGDLYDDNGELISSGQFIQDVAKEMGFDGLIQKADDYFGANRVGPFGIKQKGMTGVYKNTLHIMPFSSDQIKSSIGNIGTFGQEKPTAEQAARLGMTQAQAEKAQAKGDIRLSIRAPKTPEFKTFFGQSKIVDKDGEPRVMYHGTARDITEFRPQQAGAIFVSPNPEISAGYAQQSASWMADHADEFLTPEQLKQTLKDAKALLKDNGYTAKQITALEADNSIYKTDEYREAVGKFMPSGPNIIPVFVRAENPFDYEDDKTRKLVLRQVNQQRETSFKDSDFLKTNNWIAIEDPVTQQVLRNMGFDSFYVQENGVKNLAVYSPLQIKSAIGNEGGYSLTNPDIRKSLRAKWSDDRINKLVRAYGFNLGGREKDTKAFAAAIKPEDFLRATATKEERQRIAEETKPLDPEMLAQEDQELYLEIEPTEEDGVYQIKNHEGRHRMTALMNAGYDTPIPVTLRINRRNAETEQEVYLKPQKYRQGNRLVTAPRGIFVSQMVPISHASKAELRDTFGGEADIKFSLRTLPSVSTDVSDRVTQTVIPRIRPGFIERIQDAFTPTQYSKFRAQFINRFDVMARNDREAARQIKLMGGTEQLADVKSESAALYADLGGGLAAAAFGVHDRRGGIPKYKKRYLVEKDFQQLGEYDNKADADRAAQQIGAQVYEIGHTVITNEGDVEGLIKIYAPLMAYERPTDGSPDVWSLYQFWADVKRASKYLLNPQTGKYEEKLFEQADIDRAAEIEREFPEFVEIHKKWIKYNNGLVDFMRDTGVISAEGAAEMKSHGDYFPFYRHLGEDDIQGPKLFSSISGVKGPRAATGSEAPVTDFFETIVRNTQSAIQAGIKNIAARRATDQAMRIGQVARMPSVTTGPAAYRVLENGKEVYYEANDLMFVEALKALNQADIPGLGFIAKPAQLLRTLVTKDPAFMFANLMRDSMSAWQTSGVKMTPIAATMKQFATALRGTSPELDALYKAGILGGYDYSHGVEQSAKSLEAEMKKEMKVRSTIQKLTSPITSLWGALEKGSAASDAATRMEIYKKVMEQTGNEAEALWQSLEVMNFNRKGRSPIIRILTAAVPFMNARIQGLDVLYRTGIRPALASDTTDAERERFKTFWTRGMVMMGLATMYWAMTHDDDDYKKQEQETRDNYWLIPSLGIKIPIAFEVGFMFKVVPERIMQYAFGSDTGEDFLRSMGRQLHSTFAVGFPQIINPMLEVGVNHSFFTGRPIIGQGLEDVAPEYQVGPNTSRMSAAIGQSLGISPMKLDHLIQGYSGTMGMYAVDLVDSFLGMNAQSPKASKRFEQMPVIRRFLLDPEARGTVTGYYELKHSVDEAVRTTNFLERSQDFENYGKFARENIGLLATRDYINDLEKTMKQFREMKNTIRISSMDADAKRDALVSIGKMEQQLTANIQYLKKQAK